MYQLMMNFAYRNIFDHGWLTLKVEINSLLSETLPSRSTGVAVTLLLNELLNPTPSGQNFSCLGRLSVHTSPHCTDPELLSGRASLSRNRIVSPTPESDWSTSRHVKTTWSLLHLNLSSHLPRTRTRHRTPESLHRKMRETTLLFGKSRLDCYSELSLVKHLLPRLPLVLIPRIFRLPESSPGHCCDGPRMTSTSRDV
jgi:hypothetical protein